MEDVKGKIVLIFNDKLAWYPLMGRDNVEESPYLQRLVEQYREKSVSLN